MRWRKFNGETINLPIKDAVEEAIKREHDKGVRLKVCIGTDSQVKGEEQNLQLLLFFCGSTTVASCTSIMRNEAQVQH